jgi:hypothetical protein
MTSRLISPLVRGALGVAVLLGLSGATAVSAQSAQKVSVQFAALATSINGTGSSSIAGLGIEPQLRYNLVYAREQLAGFSLGLGAQWTSHSKGGENMKIKGLFLEPRWVPRSVQTKNREVIPYLSGRLALLNQSSDFGTSSMGAGFGAGVGLAISLSQTVNIDGGVQLVRQTFGDFTFTNVGGNVGGSFNPFTTYAAKLGVTVGLPGK